MNWNRKIEKWKKEADETFELHLEMLERKGFKCYPINDGCSKPNYELIPLKRSLHE